MAAVTAFIAVDSSVHWATLHCRNTNVLPLGGDVLSGVVIGTAVGAFS